MGTPEVVLAPVNAKESGAQDRSTIRFPYLDQDDAVAIAKKIFEVGGKSCEKVALAGSLNVSPDGGGFNLRLGTAKMFGLISGEKKTLSLTDLGSKIVDPATEKTARVESFLLVPLYKKIYEDYNGQMLPAPQALEAHMEKVGVAPKQKDKARQVFQRSATEAGFFATNTNRLIAPQMRSTDPQPDPKLGDTPKTGAEDDQRPKGGSGSGNGGGPHLHPFVQGLLETLPATATNAKAEWPLQGRIEWLQTAAGIFNLIYKTTGTDSGAVKVSLEAAKSSAN